MTGMTYIPALGRYVMVVWHYKTYNLRADPRTIDNYYEAPRPWGPWTKFKTIDTDKIGLVCTDYRAEIPKADRCKPGWMPSCM